MRAERTFHTHPTHADLPFVLLVWAGMEADISGPMAEENSTQRLSSHGTELNGRRDSTRRPVRTGVVLLVVFRLNNGRIRWIVGTRVSCLWCFVDD